MSSFALLVVLAGGELAGAGECLARRPPDADPVTAAPCTEVEAALQAQLTELFVRGHQTVTRVRELEHELDGANRKLALRARTSTPAMSLCPEPLEPEPRLDLGPALLFAGAGMAAGAGAGAAPNGYGSLVAGVVAIALSALGLVL